MRVAARMFGGYYVAIHGGGIAITITAPDGREVFLRGEDSALLCDEFETAVSDIAEGCQTRFARIRERAAADELFGYYFA